MAGDSPLDAGGAGRCREAPCNRLAVDAPDREGTIPDDPILLARLCFMDAVPDLDAFVELGFLERRQPDANTTPTRRRPGASVTPRYNQPARNELEPDANTTPR